MFVTFEQIKKDGKRSIKKKWKPKKLREMIESLFSGGAMYQPSKHVEHVSPSDLSFYSSNTGDLICSSNHLLAFHDANRKRIFINRDPYYLYEMTKAIRTRFYEHRRDGNTGNYYLELSSRSQSTQDKANRRYLDVYNYFVRGVYKKYKNSEYAIFEVPFTLFMETVYKLYLLSGQRLLNNKLMSTLFTAIESNKTNACFPVLYPPVDGNPIYPAVKSLLYETDFRQIRIPDKYCEHFKNNKWIFDSEVLLTNVFGTWVLMFSHPTPNAFILKGKFDFNDGELSTKVIDEILQNTDFKEGLSFLYGPLILEKYECNSEHQSPTDYSIIMDYDICDPFQCQGIKAQHANSKPGHNLVSNIRNHNFGEIALNGLYSVRRLNISGVISLSFYTDSGLPNQYKRFLNN